MRSRRHPNQTPLAVAVVAAVGLPNRDGGAAGLQGRHQLHRHPGPGGNQRSPIEKHLEAQKANGALAEQAEALLAEIDQEADARRAAIQGLLGTAPAKTSTRGRKATPEAS